MLSRLKDWGLNRDIFMLGLARAADSFGASLMIILIPLFVKHFDVSFLALPTTILIGFILSTYGFTNTATQPTVGVLVDKFGKLKFFIITGLSLYALATLLFIWINSFPGLVGLRFVQGVGVALTLPATMTLMTDYTEPKTRGTAMSFYNVMRLVGFSTGPLIGGFLIAIYGFTTVIVIAATTGGIGALLVLLLVEEPTVDHGSLEQAGFLENFGAFFDEEMVDFAKLAFANVAMALSISLVAPLENEFNAKLNQGPEAFGVAFSALIITLMFVQIPIGRLADTIGRKVLIVVGLLILVPTTIWMGYVFTTWQFVLARMIQGVGVACVAAPSFALGGDKSSRGKRGKEMSLLTMAFGLGIGLGPLIAGLLAGLVTFQSPFWLGGILLAFSALLVALSVPKSKIAESNNTSAAENGRTSQ